MVQAIDFCDPNDREKREDFWITNTLYRGIKYERN